jgi:methylmalonyl-CoA mutase
MDNSAEARSAWAARVEKLLKGERPISALSSRTADGIIIEPLYQQRQGQRADRARHAPWRIVQRVDHPKAEAANRQALEDLKGGANGLALLSASAENMPLVLKDVLLHAIHIRLEGGDALASAFAGHVAKQPIDPARLDVTFDTGDAGLIRDLKAQGFAGPFLMADGRAQHNDGATEAQELASVLAGLAAGVRAAGDASAVSATLAATQDMFLTLAKFRSLRLLWARLLEASGLAHQALQVHGETSLRMMAALDPHSNILRATAAVFGAGLGGADSITVLPFSTKQGLPNAFARRVARNTQLVLLEESNLWRVADAASGAGYIEHLTDELCGRAWEMFRNLESGGKPLAIDPDNASCKPIVGVSAYKLEKELEAAIEALD